MDAHSGFFFSLKINHDIPSLKQLSHAELNSSIGDGNLCSQPRPRRSQPRFKVDVNSKDSIWLLSRSDMPFYHDTR